jgi:hypothetical protein
MFAQGTEAAFARRMTTGRSSIFLLLSASLVACGGIVAESGASSQDAGPSPAPGTATDGGSVVADAATSDASRAAPSAGVVWMHAEASGFDARACNDPAPGSDFLALGDYLFAQAKLVGLEGAAVSSGGGVCSFASSPTTMAETYVFAGTPAAAQALKANPPAPFRGTYLTAPLVVKQALNVKFELYVGDRTAHAFDDVWVHDGLDFDAEAAFASDICNKKPAFDAAIGASPVGAAVKAWLSGANAGSPYELGYDATFSFDDGTTLRIANAHQAAGGPYLAPCPNPFASP